MKKCELCDSLAKMYCESDQASLCWDCDANVHGANFLVAKHSRTLLCHLCQSFTPWTASGPKLSPTVSVCNNCVKDSICREERENEDDKREDDDDDDDDDTEDENDDGEYEDDEENQVVPWSSSTTTASPPVSNSSNSDQECSEGVSKSRIVFSSKRMREMSEPVSQDRRRCLLSQELAFPGSSSTSRPLKDQKRTMRDSHKGLPESKVLEDIYKLNKETGVIDHSFSK